MMFQDTRTPTVATLSRDREAMQSDIDLIADILGGLPAMRANAGKYLPPYDAEGRDEWQRRVNSAPWRAEFADALATLSGKPFSKPVSLPADAPAAVMRFVDDVTNDGENLHAFARRVFQDAASFGITLVGVAYASRPWARSRAEEKAIGARPYWFSIPAASVIAAYENARRELVHIRWQSVTTERDGDFGEREVKRIHVYETGRWQTWIEVKSPREGGKYWEMEAEGQLNGATLPIVRIRFGERLGVIRTRPPLLDLAHMQVELWRALSRLDETLTYSGSPMLSATGVDPAQFAQGGLKVGPKACLFAPEGGAWGYVQPDADVLREVAEHARTVIEDMQRLALQPTLAKAVASTATEVALAHAKANSVLESWALSFRDALEHALELTLPMLAVWTNAAEEERALRSWAPTINLHCDFDGDAQGATEARLVIDAAKAGVVSRVTATEELQRRGILGPTFDPAAEDTRLGQELPEAAE
ncbi:DUF4055 domain-containing protein [Methylocystis echinoides]|uniref:DUF4055 domain-containing protein n=1 Tax=Methylocystis echinoides TaxID=29468 RepID=UPI0034314A9F